MNELIEGVVLSKHDYADNDLLLKIFTRDAGIVSFLVRGAKKPNNKFSGAFEPSTRIVFNGRLSKSGNGLGYLNDLSLINQYEAILEDIYISAWFAYISDIINTALEEYKINTFFYDQLIAAIDKLNQHLDPQIIANIFQIQLLELLGLQMNWRSDALDEKITNGDFDYSEKYAGIIERRHWHLDEHRVHADQKVIFYLRQFSQIDIKQINSININQRTKRGIALILDMIYERQVGIVPKSKKFIEQMNNFKLN